MRITFVVPGSASGGRLVMATYSGLLAARGHRILLVSPAQPPPRTAFSWFRKRFARGEGSTTVDAQGVEHRVLDRARPVVDADLPAADLVVATWWSTAEWVAALDASKGVKAHFVQGHEVYPWLPQDRTRRAHRLPLRKVVISKWLADIMRVEYGDATAILVPNGIDHAQFHAPPRGRQSRPTVGLLYSEVPFKGFEASIAMLAEMRRGLPELQVLSFGFEAPRRALPDFVEFIRDPPRETLRDLYARCDVWLTASSSEGFNMPAIEAMACRTPVVAFRTGWPADAVVEGVNGACLEIGDFDGLRRATEALLRLPDAEWRRISDGAFETVRDMNWRRSADAFEAALVQIATAGRDSVTDQTPPGASSGR
jgi:glycosyltransferase involved in cell wall biosynthesis